MELSDDVVRPLMRAGRAALPINAPMSDHRVRQLCEMLTARRPQMLVDLGCGRGAFARAAAQGMPESSVIGIDIDAEQIAEANTLADAAGLGVSFEVADATEWSGPADAAICVGASHAFGGSEEMLERLGSIVPSGVVVIGDGVWTTEPSPWCLETFGPLPAGVDELAQRAVGHGWEVSDTSASTLDEWDEFEHRWIAGVRGVGSDAAEAFALQREREYEQYRGVLGFGWLVLAR